MNTITGAVVAYVSLQEGVKLLAYQDGGGVWTIGVGATRVDDGEPVRKGMTCTRDQALTWLKRDLQTAANAVNRVVKVAINANQFTALVDLCFNIGEGAFGGSTLVKLINEGRFNEAALNFGEWVHDDGRVVNGLVHRRASERALFLTPA